MTIARPCSSHMISLNALLISIYRELHIFHDSRFNNIASLLATFPPLLFSYQQAPVIHIIYRTIISNFHTLFACVYSFILLSRKLTLCSIDSDGQKLSPQDDKLYQTWNLLSGGHSTPLPHRLQNFKAAREWQCSTHSC